MAELLSSIHRRAFFAHVLALPVSTQITRVRGVQGYQLPKWLAGIEVEVGAQAKAAIFNTDGTPDLSLSAPLPERHEVPSQSYMSTNTMIHRVDGRWHQTSVQSNTLAYGRTLSPRGVTLSKHHGPMSDLLSGLHASGTVRLDIVKDAQIVLNMPVPLSGLG